MSKAITSEGKCFYCDEKFSQKGIAKHLAKHLSATEREKPSEKERGYHLSIEAGNMSDKFFRVLSQKMKFDYIYDYGSTTSFLLKVEGVYQIDQKKDIVLLSRNEPLKILCSLCKKNSATSFCTVHAYETDECFLCEKCAAKHGKKCDDFSDYAEMPVVNSPRMGICGYTGGSVEVERDGVYKG